MYRGHSVGVVVPAYNEEAQVGDVLASIPQCVDRIYAVDDRSTDRTWELIQSMAAAELSVRDAASRRASAPATPQAPTVAEAGDSIADGGTAVTRRIVPIRHERNQGAGAALRTGYLRALDDRVDIVVSMDADGQMDPEQLPRLLDPIVNGVADYAKGNRLSSWRTRGRMPAFRLLGNWLLTYLTKVSSGYWRLSDPQNGYTAISHEALSQVGIEAIPDDHDYTNDLLVRLNEHRLRIIDVAMPAVYNDEESTIRYRTFVSRTSWTLLRGFVRRQRSRHAGREPTLAPALYAVGIAGLIGSLAAALASLVPIVDPGISIAFVATGALLAITAVAVAVALDARANAALEVHA